MQNIFWVVFGEQFLVQKPRTFSDWHEVIFSSFCLCCQFVHWTENVSCSFYFLDIKHNLCCGSTSVVQFMFWKHMFAYSINIHLSVIIQHTWYFCSSSEHSSVDNQMWLMKEKSHRKGAFSHCICLNAEGIFLCVGERADVLCIIFDYVAIACIWL